MGKSDDFVMPLGKYRGESLRDIADDDEGLKYLDWLVGQSWVNGRLKAALEDYLGQPHVKRELDRILDD